VVGLREVKQRCGNGTMAAARSKNGVESTSKTVLTLKSEDSTSNEGVRKQNCQRMQVRVVSRSVERDDEAL